jgi:catechol O-methyltransferase
MNVGTVKGTFVTNLIADRKPSVMIELGGYVGYSAILFGDAIRANGGKQFLSIEKNPEVAAVANQLVDLAGLRDVVRILVGASDEVLRELICDRKEITQVEMIFIDHWQKLYRPDLWLLEELGVLVPETSVLLADNVIMPGAPEYLEWVHATTEQKKELAKKLDVGSLTPNPNLIYETAVSEFDTDFGKVCPGTITIY